MRRFVPRAVLAAAVAVSAAACATGGGAGVEPGGDTGGRYLVMIPAFDGPSGDRVANELRALVTEMDTHVALSERAVRRAMSEYELEQLTEVEARQLAAVIDVRQLLWGTVSEGGAGLEADVKFIDTSSGDEIGISGMTGATPEELAAAIFVDLERSIEGVRQAIFCNDYLSSEQYDRALDTCENALAMAPESGAALYGKATALLNLERDEEALVTYEELLEIDPSHQDALLGAGLAASRLDRRDHAMGFYTRYLEVNPGNVDVRMTIANDIAQTGDHISAFRVLETAIDDNSDNTEFQGYLFDVATAAGQRASEGGDADESREIFEVALAAYEAAFSNGDGPGADDLQQVITVYNELGRTDDAIRMAQDGTERYADDPRFWSLYATVLNTSERYADAIEALEQVRSLDPEFQDVEIRIGRTYLLMGQRQDAMPYFQRAAAAGDSDRVSALLFNEGATAARSENWSDAASVLSLAHEYSDGEARRNVEYLWGASLVQQAAAMERSNRETNNPDVIERVLQLAQQSLQLLQASATPQAQQVIPQVQQLIANQEATLQSLRR